MSSNKYIGIKLIQFIIALVFVIGFLQIQSISYDIFDTVFIIGYLLIISAIITGIIILVPVPSICIRLILAVIILMIFCLAWAIGQLMLLGLDFILASLLAIIVCIIELYAFYQLHKAMES